LELTIEAGVAGLGLERRLRSRVLGRPCRRSALRHRPFRCRCDARL